MNHPSPVCCHYLPLQSLWKLESDFTWITSLTGFCQCTTLYKVQTEYPTLSQHQSLYRRVLRAWTLVPGSTVFLEKAMAPHSSTLAWKISWTEEPGRLQSVGSLRVRYDWATSLSLFTFMDWRRKWQPTPVFLPGESQGWGSLVSCCLWGHTESDTTEAT